MEFYVIRLKKIRPPPKKIKVYPSIQYHVFLVNMHYTLHWLSRLVTKLFVYLNVNYCIYNPSS